MENLLKFSNRNSKVNKGAKLYGKRIFTFTLPAGFTCQGAMDCKSFSDRITGKITDAPGIKFRCYEASLEAVYKGVRNVAWHNYDLLVAAKNTEAMAALIQKSLPEKAEVIRIHVGGDFMSQKYFDAWLQVAKQNPKVLFYAYTKSLNYWTARIDEIPTNFKLNASRGSRFDYLIDVFKLKSVLVVPSEEAAKILGLPVDNNDTHAWAQNKSFALVIHGTQPKGLNFGK